MLESLHLHVQPEIFPCAVTNSLQIVAVAPCQYPEISGIPHSCRGKSDWAPVLEVFGAVPKDNFLSGGEYVADGIFAAGSELVLTTPDTWGD